jgi:peptidoglycan L-alanyl-D-glutamate endopeptidase CwlK
MANAWGRKSKEQYDTAHPDLQLIADTVLQIHDCSFKQGHRDQATQDKYFNNGTSKVKWPNGKHNKTPSQAMDLAPYIKGENPYDMERVLFFAGIVMAVADMLYSQGKISHKLKWGGSWRTEANAVFAFDRNGFFDGIHFELVM